MPYHDSAPETNPTLPWDSDDCLSVSELTDQLKTTLEQAFGGVRVGGEISDFVHSASGHLYFSLRDEASQIRAVIWRSTAQRLKFELEDGMEVVCRGDVSVYAPRGSYQLVVQRIEPVGIGALQLAFQQLYQKLKSKGWFDPQHKQAIPAFPKRIGIVTSPSGAALHDVWQAACRRWRDFECLVFPSQVQGDAAPLQLCTAIQNANRIQPPLDVLVVARGGGSAEDIWCFNDERVVRAVFESEVPVISAVGHEVDLTLCDLAADLRALTPTQVGEFITPDGAVLRRQVTQAEVRLLASARNALESARRDLRRITDRPVFCRPLDRLRQLSDRCVGLRHRLMQAAANRAAGNRARIAELSGRLEAISPLNVLARGYSLTKDAEGRLISDSGEVEVGSLIETQLARGWLRSVVREKE